MSDTPATAGSPGTSGRARTYTGSDVEVSWDAARCLHAAACIHALPRVFDPDARPWVQADNAAADAVVAAVEACPTGALQHSRPESQPVPTRCEVRPDGPYQLRGQVTLVDDPTGSRSEHTRLALCRCGATGHPPYCDNSHQAVGFSAPPGVAADTVDGLAAKGCTVTAYSPGPLVVSGPLEVHAPDGQVLAAGTDLALCRCGRSGSKPLCDGSHAQV